MLKSEKYALAVSGESEYWRCLSCYDGYETRSQLPKVPHEEHLAELGNFWNLQNSLPRAAVWLLFREQGFLQQWCWASPSSSPSSPPLLLLLLACRGWAHHVQSLPLQHMKRHVGHQGNLILSIKAGWKAMLGYNKPDLSVHRYQAAQASHRYFSWYFLSRPNCSWEVRIVYETSTESRCCRHPISNLWLTFPLETFHPKGLTFQSPPPFFFFVCPSKFAYCKHFSSLLWWNRAKTLHNGGTRC